MKNAALTLQGWFAALLFVAFSVWTLNGPATPDLQPTTASAVASTSHKIYIPLASLVRPATDLLIEHIEPIQAIQTDANSVPLVAGKATILRVYTRASALAPVSGVNISISATRDGQALAGSPLVFGPGSVPEAWSRGDLNSSFNIPLPADWLSGNVELTLTLDSTDSVYETSESNNVVSAGLNFTNVPSLSVQVVPIVFADPSSGLVYPAAASDFLQADILKLYPMGYVGVGRRAAINFAQNLNARNGWDGLLDRVTTIKKTDGAPFYQVYYGLVPLEDESGNTWFTGYIGGVGWQGDRVSVGVTDSDALGINGGEVAAHEIGHNLNRQHAPCGVHPADPGYPYAGGLIGSYGLDVASLTLKLSSMTDLMGYCASQWISDYTYNGLMQDQIRWGTTARPATGDGLLVRAAVNPDGSLSLDPFYRLQGPIDPPAKDSPLQIQFLDAAGQVLLTYSLAELVTPADDGGQRRAIISVVPLPQQPYSQVRLLRNGQVWAQKAISAVPLVANGQALDKPTLQVEAGQLLLRWGAAHLPAVVRYTQDGGQRYTTLALDATGGELAVSLASLPFGELQFEVILADANLPAYILPWSHTP